MDKLDAATIRLRWRAWSGDPLLSPTAIRQAGDGKLDSSLRSVYWRMYLGQLPVPHSSTAPFSGWQIALEHSRAEWASLRTTYLRSPDGVWVNDAPQGKAATHAERSSPIREANGALTKASDATASNPLGLETSNPWRQWFADLELRKALWQDVERTMPEVDYFRDHRIQLAMVNLLHVWTRLNSGIGYRQGMHELLAYLIWVLDSESCPSTSSPRSPLSDLDNSEAIMHLVLSATYLEHDVWSLFSNMMKAASSWYDSTPSIPMPSARATVSGLGNLNDRVTLLQPIVGQSIRIFDVLLRRMDPELFGKLESLSIEPQMWGIRWIRLMFGREFPPAAVLTLWDAIFAEDPALRLVDYICVAMLLRVRNKLLGADYSTALQLLLRYPSDAVPDTALLVRQAIHLRDNPSPLGAASVHQQNIGLGLASPLSPSPSPTIEQRRAQSHRRAESALPAGLKRAQAAAPALLAQGGGLVGDLAQNVFERAESLGLNRAIGTLGELRRNVGSYHAALASPASYATAFVPRTPSPSVSTSTASNASLANALALALDVLDLHADRTPAARAALHALRHVSDVLGGAARDFDPAVLVPLRSPAPAPAPGLPPMTTAPPSPALSVSAASGKSRAPSLLLGTRDGRPLSTSLPRVPYTTDAWRQAAKWSTSATASASSPVVARTPSPREKDEEGEGVTLEAVRGDARRVIDDPLGAL